ncbi:MAG: hypothetical protein ABW193_06415 [Luteibacter sp.]
MKRLALASSLLMLICIAVYLNVAVYQEFFSSGPPHFGMHENMDKWEDPRPCLAISDLVLVLAIWKTTTSMRRIR